MSGWGAVDNAKKASNPGWKQRYINTGAGAGSKILDILGRPGNAVLSSGRAGAEANGFFNTLGANVSGFGRGLTGKEHLTFKQAVLGRDAGPVSGFGEHAIDFVGSVATDPTSIIGLGGSKVGAKAAEQALVETAGKKALLEFGGTEAKNLAQMAAQREATNILKTQGAKAALSQVGKADVKQALKETALANDITPRRNLLELVAGRAKGGEAGAERFANRSIRALETSNLPETAIGRATLGAENAAKAKLAVPFKAVGSTKAAQFAQNLFQNNAELKRVVGSETVASLNEVKGTANAAQHARIQEVTARIRAADKGVKGGYTDKIDRAMAKALEDPKYASELIRRRPDLADSYNVRREILTSNTNRQIESGVMKASDAAKSSSYLPHAVTAEGQKVLQSSKGQSIIQRMPSQIKKAFEQGGYINERKLKVNVREANKILNAEAKKQGLITKDIKFFSEEATPAILHRVGKAEEAIKSKTYLDSLTKIRDSNTRAPLAITAEDTTKVPHNYVKVDLGPLGEAKVHPAIVNDLKETTRILHSDKDIKAIAKGYDAWEAWWKSGATSIPISGAFTARNARSNFILNWFGGVHNVADYTNAGKIQYKVGRVFNGKEFRQALIDGDVQGALKKALGEHDYNIYKGALKHDVISSTYAATELGAADKAKVHKFLGELGPSGKFAKAGRKGNQAVEENARLAHYIAKINEGASPAEAALSVKKWLFDYNDLSPFEKRVLKKANVFYTFNRKNLPRQVEALFTQTGKFTGRAHAVNEVTSTPDLGENPPSYLRGSRAVNPAIAKLLGIPEGVQGLTNPDNPLAAAEQYAAPALGTLASIPGVGKAIPQGYKPMDNKELARQYLQLFSGPIPATAQYAVGEGTGVSPFSGYRNKPGNEEALLRALKAANPAAGKAQNLFKGDRNARLLQLLTGLTVKPNPTQR